MASPLDSMMLSGGFMPDQGGQQGQLPVQLGYTATGPAAVPYINQSMENYQGAVDRSFRASDTANEYNKMMVDQTKQMQPYLEAMRKIGMGQADIEQGLLDNGTRRQQAQTGADADIADKLNKADASKIEAYQRKANGWLALKELKDAGPMTPAKWKHMQEIGTQYGIRDKMGDQGDSDFSAHIDAAAKMSTQVIGHVQQMDLQRLKNQNSVDVANIQGATARETTAMQTQAHLAGIAMGMPAREAEAYNRIANGTANAGDLAIIANMNMRALGPAVLSNGGVVMAMYNMQQAAQAAIEETDPKKKEYLKGKAAAYSAEAARLIKMPFQEAREAAKPDVPTTPGGGETLPKGVPAGSVKQPDGTYVAPDGSTWGKK